MIKINVKPRYITIEYSNKSYLIEDPYRIATIMSIIYNPKLYFNNYNDEGIDIREKGNTQEISVENKELEEDIINFLSVMNNKYDFKKEKIMIKNGLWAVMIRDGDPIEYRDGKFIGIRLIQDDFTYLLEGMLDKGIYENWDNIDYLDDIPPTSLYEMFFFIYYRKIKNIDEYLKKHYLKLFYALGDMNKVIHPLKSPVIDLYAIRFLTLFYLYCSDKEYLKNIFMQLALSNEDWIGDEIRNFIKQILEVM